MLNDGYIKSINLLENHTRIFDEKLSTVNENFYINDVRNADSIYIYGILDSNNNMYFIYKILEQGVQTSKIYDPSC